MTSLREQWDVYRRTLPAETRLAPDLERAFRAGCRAMLTVLSEAEDVAQFDDARAAVLARQITRDLARWEAS